jgi:hypothetical protein
MKDLDERLLMERYENIFSGKIEEDEDTSLDSVLSKKDDDDEDDDKEESDDKEDSDDKGSDDSDDDDDSEESDDSEDESEDESEDDEEGGFPKKSKEGGDSGIQSKVKQLQKQYNDLLIDAFERYAAECIENALSTVETSFGENITDILDQALQDLKTKILDDLGVEDCCGGMTGDMGGMEIELGGEPEVKFGPEVGGIPTMMDSDDDDSDEPEESDDDDSDDEDEEDKKKDKEVEESRKCKLKKKQKIVSESVLAAKFYGFV